MDAGALGIVVYCNYCPNSQQFSMAHALVLWGPDATFPEVAARARCSKCRELATGALPKWPYRKSAWGPAIQDVPSGWDNLNGRRS